MTCRESDQLTVLTVEYRIAINDQRGEVLLCSGSKTHVDLVRSAGCEDPDPLPDSLGDGQHVGSIRFAQEIVRICEKADRAHRGAGHDLAKVLKTLHDDLADEKRHAGDIATRSA